ncbi:MAG: oligosaccharide flippase family protein [Pricia sp.]
MFKKLLNNIVFKNFSYLTIGTVIAQVISLITILKITDFLSPDDYGLFTFLIAQGMLLLKIGDLGNMNIVIRTIARRPERTNDLVVNVAIIRTLAVISLFLLYIVYNYYLGSLSVENLGLLFIFSLISCFSSLFELVFMGHQKMLPTSIINLAYSIIWFLIVFLVLDRNSDVSYIFLFYILASLTKAALFYTFLRRYHLLQGKVQNFFVSSKQLIAESWPYFAIILIMLPLTSLSNNFLDINSSNEEIGYFNLSQKLIGPISLVITMLLTAVFPNLSSLWGKDEEKFKKYLSAGFGAYMLTGMIICFLFALFSKEVVALLFPKGYQAAIQVCQIQVWYLFLTSVDSLIGVVLGAANREKMILRYSLVYFLICTPTLFFGSYYGAIGLSYAYVFSFGISMLYVWVSFKKTLQLKIQNDGLIWVLALALFIISYFVSLQTLLIYKIAIALAVVGLLSVYLLKKFKPLLVR